MKLDQDLEIAFDAGFSAGIESGVDLIRSAQKTLRWAWWLMVIEAVLIAAFVMRVGVLWFFGEAQ